MLRIGVGIQWRIPTFAHLSPLTLTAFRFLWQHVAELGYIADESLDSLGLLVGKQSVLMLDHSMPTILAFQKMYARGMTGAAVKATGNQMIANLSISDLRLAYLAQSHGTCCIVNQLLELVSVSTALGCVKNMQAM